MIRRYWRWIQARFRLDLEVVCELSRGRGLLNDFHDFPDDIVGTPCHFVTMTCKRCGKQFGM